MSTIKVDTYLTRGGASEIAIDKLKGASSASSISVVAEGGTVTTNLQQGLGKAWCNVGGGASPINDSINLSSITDTAVGNHDLNWTNAFSNTGYSHSGSDNYFGLFMTEPNTQSTGEANVFMYNNSFALRDNAFATIAHGDLA